MSRLICSSETTERLGAVTNLSEFVSPSHRNQQVLAAVFGLADADMIDSAGRLCGSSPCEASGPLRADYGTACVTSHLKELRTHPI
jgi:hypothetical protein